MSHTPQGLYSLNLYDHNAKVDLLCAPTVVRLDVVFWLILALETLSAVTIAWTCVLS